MTILDPALLEGVRTIVTHENCSDGVASALILVDAIPAARVCFVQHNTTGLRDLPAEPGMLFCDIVPPRERVAEFVDAGAIVLDHHRGAREIVEAFGPRGVFADEVREPGVSGATLAFRKVWIQIRGSNGLNRPVVERFATLAGIRDTWQRPDPRWAEASAQAAALRFWPWENLRDALWKGGWSAVETMLAIGPVLVAKDAERDKVLIREAYRFEAGGHRVACFEGLQTSDVAEALAGEIDLVLGWHYAIVDGAAKMMISLRGRGSFPLLDFAKRHGGGGHTQAAGFQIAVPPASPDPYTFLQNLVCRHLEIP